MITQMAGGPSFCVGSIEGPRAVRGPLDCNRQSERQTALESCPLQCANALPWGFQQEEQEAVLGHCSSAVGERGFVTLVFMS